REWFSAHPEVPKPVRPPKPPKPPTQFPDVRQRLFLFRLAFGSPSTSNAGVAKLLGPALRGPLQKEKWVEERRNRRTVEIDLTDAGWHLGEEPLSVPVTGGL